MNVDGTITRQYTPIGDCSKSGFFDVAIKVRSLFLVMHVYLYKHDIASSCLEVSLVISVKMLVIL